MYFTFISDVIDVLGEVLWQQNIVLQCRIQRDYLLNVLGNTGNVWKSQGSSNIETFSLVLLLLPRS